jgi:bacteriorhodopsin
MFGVLWILGREGRRHAKALGVDIHRVYLTCAVWTLLIWICYPISWGVSEGGNVIAPDSEAVFYGVLDFCSKVIFAIMFIVGHWSIDPARLGLHLRDYDEPLYVPGEKPGSPPAFGAAPAGHSVVRDDNA